MIIYLDLDGVLVDCHVEAVKFYGIPMTLEQWPLGQRTHEIVNAHRPGWHCNPDTLWNAFPETFWATLPKTLECDGLLNACMHVVGEKNVRIASRPTQNPGSWSGKIMWIHQNLPAWIHHQVHLTENKWELAGPDRLLIDDDHNNCIKFADAGGKTRWFPRPWGGCASPSLLSITNDLARLT